MLFVLSMWQLDAEDAEPSLDDREGQDEYTEMQMPVWPHSSPVSAWAGLAWLSFQSEMSRWSACFFFFFSLISFYLHFVSPILFLLKLFKHYIYTYVKMLRGCSMSLEQLASPVLLFFFSVYLSDLKCYVCFGGLNEFMIWYPVISKWYRKHFKVNLKWSLFYYLSVHFISLQDDKQCTPKNEQLYRMTLMPIIYGWYFCS